MHREAQALSEDKVKKALDRRRRSLDFWAPVYDECAEVYQAVKCRTSPILVTDKTGSQVEDKSRTNVCMPGPSIMVRKNVARLTARPPQINYISESNPDVADKLTAASYWEYDVTNESKATRKVILQGEMFGFGVSKLFQDDVVVKRQFRVPTKMATRTQLLLHQGVDQSEIDKSRAGNPNYDQLAEEEIIAAMTQFGDELQYEEQIKKYSGPVVKFIFMGDIHLPPGCESLETADWILEEFTETPTWLELMASKKYKDPETGEMVPVMDADAVQELIESDPEMPLNEKTSLRDRLREIVKLDGESLQQNSKEIRSSKKFKFIETHEKRDGEFWVSWIGNDNKFLGEMPYPFNLYGESAYTDYVPLPDLINAIGDSTPRLGRFLHRLHNANTGQRQDLINNYMRPMVITSRGADIDDEATQRAAFQEIKVRSVNDIQVQRIPDVPSMAWENEAAILRQQATLEPSMASADMAGTNAEPQQGKTATVGVLAQRERDTLLQYKVDGLQDYFKRLYRKKLWIRQQTMDAPITLGEKYVSQTMLSKNGQDAKGISMRTGKAEVITLDWTEIQSDIQVEPEAGSTLSIEDEFHRMGWQSLYQAAQAAPQVFDMPYVARGWAGTIHGVDARKAILPPAGPPPPPPPKVSVNISIDPSKYPADIQNQALEMIGFQPSEELVHRDTVDGIKRIGEAADASAKLEEPAGADAIAVGDGTQGIRRTAANRV